MADAYPLSILNSPIPPLYGPLGRPDRPAAGPEQHTTLDGWTERREIREQERLCSTAVVTESDATARALGLASLDGGIAKEGEVSIDDRFIPTAVLLAGRFCTYTFALSHDHRVNKRWILCVLQLHQVLPVQRVFNVIDVHFVRTKNRSFGS